MKWSCGSKRPTRAERWAVSAEWIQGTVFEQRLWTKVQRRQRGSEWGGSSQFPQ